MFTDKNKKLIQMCAKRQTDIAKIKAFIDKNGIDVNAGYENALALPTAISFSHYGVAEMLLEAGADPKRSGAYGGHRANVPPLHLALLHNKAGFAQKLLDKGAVINSETTINYLVSEYATTFPSAMVDAILDATTDIDKCDSRGYSALMKAAAHGKEDMVQRLCERGADLTRKDQYDRIPYQMAKTQKAKDILASHMAAQNIPLPVDPQAEKNKKNPDFVTLDRKLDNEWTQVEVYDFTEGRRTVTLTNRKGDFQGSHRDDFSAITDKSRLQEAFNEHHQRGGTKTEADFDKRAVTMPLQLKGGV